MIKVSIDSVRASLLSQHRVVVLKEEGMDRYLAIWIGPYEADAITIKLQGVEIARPLTHDLSLIHISEPTRLLSISYAVFCLKKKKKHTHTHTPHPTTLYTFFYITTLRL